MDAYTFGVTRAVEEFAGRCIAVITRKGERGDKLFVVPDGKRFSEDEIRRQVVLQEQFRDSGITLNREESNSSVGGRSAGAFRCDATTRARGLPESRCFRYPAPRHSFSARIACSGVRCDAANTVQGRC